MNQISIQQQQGYTQKLRKIESEAGSVIGFNDEGQIDAITRTYDMGVVVHGATASTARPSAYAVVTWIGSVEPDNAINNDIWEEV